MGAAADTIDSRGPGRGGARRGEIRHRTLRTGPRLDYYLYVPQAARPDAPLFVSVHGASGSALDHARIFAPLAERHGAVLAAPCFEKPHYGDYQRLGRARRGERADLALDRLADEVGRLAGLDTPHIHLFGHSGGAQFAQRYAFAHPERVAGAVLASAGWYTFPSRARRYPYGIRPTPDLPAVAFRLEAILRVPLLVLVGTRSLGRRRTLRRSPRLDAQQGRSRLERATRFVRAMETAAHEHGLAPSCFLQALPDAEHAFAPGRLYGGVAERAASFLFEGRELLHERVVDDATASRARTSTATERAR